MKNKSIVRKVIIGIIMATMVLSISTITFAANANIPPKPEPIMHNQLDKDGLRDQLDSLLAAGIITQQQENAALGLLPHKYNLALHLDDLITGKNYYSRTKK
jgi:hypothetical protein